MSGDNNTKRSQQSLHTKQGLGHEDRRNDLSSQDLDSVAPKEQLPQALRSRKNLKLKRAPGQRKLMIFPASQSQKGRKKIEKSQKSSGP